MLLRVFWTRNLSVRASTVAIPMNTANTMILGMHLGARIRSRVSSVQGKSNAPAPLPGRNEGVAQWFMFVERMSLISQMLTSGFAYSVSQVEAGPA